MAVYYQYICAGYIFCQWYCAGKDFRPKGVWYIRHVRDFVQRDRLFHPEEDAASDHQRALAERTGQALEGPSAVPHAPAQQPERDEHDADNGEREQQHDLHEPIDLPLGVELGPIENLLT